jgi:pimeloyl-ACP methyl ester carboxylesterase
MFTAPLKIVMGLQSLQLMLAAAVVLTAAGCLKGPYDKSAIEKKFVEQQQARFSQYVAGDRFIHYVAAGRRGAPLVVFIHGTPGSWHAYAELMTDELLLSQAYLVAVDRPGFGKSSKGGIVTSLAQQASFLQPLIERESTDQKAILVGHSLGAPIAVRLAMDDPKLVSGMVLVAPSLDPDLEKPKWYNHLAASPLVAWAVPRELALANQEIMPFSQELAKMLPLWSRIQVSVIVVQGQKDKLVSPANADYAERMLSGEATMVRVADQDHFILWKRPRLIRNQILALLPEPKK